MITRRAFVAGGSVAALSACATPPPTTSSREVEREAEIFPPLPAHYGAITDEPYPIPAVPEGVVPPRLWRRNVENPFSLEVPGTIVVDPNAGFLHLSLETVQFPGCIVCRSGLYSLPFFAEERQDALENQY